MTIIDSRLPTGAFETETHGDLREQTAADLLSLFVTLDAPAPSELHGDYASGLPADRDEAVRGWFADLGLGHWVGKSYLPTGAGSGEGLNMWRKETGDERSERFAWAIAPSTIGEGESLVMRYAAFNNSSGGIDLIDEVRRVREGLYVGAYHTPMAIDRFTPTMGADGVRTEPEVFLLAGPIGEWQRPDDETAELHQ